MTGFEDSGTKSLGAIKFGLVGLGIAAGAAFAKLIDFTKDSVKVAIDAQETFSKYTVVFSELGDSAESMAQQFADAFDLSSASAKDMISYTGNILTGFGATQKQALDMAVAINTLAGDLTSFTNYAGGAKGAADALTKALLGEREMAKSLGIVIRDEDVQARLAAKGQKDLTGSALNLAKANVTLEIITEQAKNSIGDYARTHDSAANSIKRSAEQTKELSVQLGTALTPAVAEGANIWGKFAGEVAKVLKQFNDLRAARESEKDGNLTTQERIDLLKGEIAEIQTATKVTQFFGTAGVATSLVLRGATQGEIDKKRELIKALEIQQRYEKQAANQSIAAKQAVSEWDAKRGEEAKKAADAELARDKARKDSATEYAGTINRLQQLYEGENITFTEYRDGIIAAAEAQRDALIEAGFNISDSGSIGAEKLREMIALINDLNSGYEKVSETIKGKFQAYTELGIKSILSGFHSIGAELANQDAEWSDFAKIALQALAAVLEAMAAELAAYAAKNLAAAFWTGGVSLAGIAPATAGAAAAYAAAGAIRAASEGFEDGGIVPGNSTTGDNVLVRTNSREMILNQEQQARLFDMIANGNGGSQTFILEVDGQTMAQAVAGPFNNGTVRLNLR